MNKTKYARIRLKYIFAPLTAISLLAGSANAALVADLEVYWSFENNLQDSHTGNIDLTDQGTIGYSSSLIGNAASFDGNDKLFSNSFVTEMGSSASATIQFWVKTSDLGGTLLRKDVTGLGWGVGESTYYLQDVSSKGAMSAVRNSGAWARTDGSVDLANDTWRHIVFVKDGNSEAIYIDGSSVSLALSAFNNSDAAGSKVYLGWSTGNDGSNAYNGLMDEVAIWSRALDADEVSLLYNGGSGLTYTQVKAVPEPSSAALIGVGGLVLALRRRK